MNTKAPPRSIRQPSLADALIPLVTLAVLIGGSIALFQAKRLKIQRKLALRLLELQVSTTSVFPTSR